MWPATLCISRKLLRTIGPQLGDLKSSLFSDSSLLPTLSQGGLLYQLYCAVPTSRLACVTTLHYHQAPSWCKKLTKPPEVFGTSKNTSLTYEDLPMYPTSFSKTPGGKTTKMSSDTMHCPVRQCPNQGLSAVEFNYEHLCCHETTARVARLERWVLVTLVQLAASNVQVSQGFRRNILEDFATLPQKKGPRRFVRGEA